MGGGTAFICQPTRGEIRGQQSHHDGMARCRAGRAWSVMPISPREFECPKPVWKSLRMQRLITGYRTFQSPFAGESLISMPLWSSSAEILSMMIMSVCSISLAAYISTIVVFSAAVFCERGECVLLSGSQMTHSATGL